MTETNGDRSMKERLAERASEHRRSESFEIKEWGETVELRSLSIGAKFAIFGEDAEIGDDGGFNMKMGDLGSMLPQVIIGTCYDPDSGERIWTEKDAEWLAEQDAGVLEPLANAGMKISGLVEEAAEEGKDAS